MVKVSVILPIYNVQDYIGKCLDTLINQTLEDIEIICVNDCSTDNSMKILEEYSVKDSRIKITNLIENKGQGNARNIGIELAKGEYIGFVDPDDWAELNMYEELYNTAKIDNCDLVECNYFIQNDMRHYKKTYKHLTKFPKNKCFNCNDMITTYPFYPMLAPWNKLYKRDFVKNNKILFEETRLCEDQIFGIKSRLLANKIRYVSKSLYYYRKRANSSANGINKDALLRPQMAYNVKEFLLNSNLWEKYKKPYNQFALAGLRIIYNSLPQEWCEEYDNSVKELFGEDFYKDYCYAKIKNNKTFLQKIFSIKNSQIKGIKYKDFTILGLSFKTTYIK